MRNLLHNTKSMIVIFIIMVSTNSLFAQGIWEGEVSKFHSAAKAVFTVNSTDDTGDSNPGDGICDDGTGNCTLRAAIEEANAYSGDDIIEFDIPDTGPYTFQPVNGFPAITDQVVIDGTTEPDFEGTPIIEIDGTNAGETFGLEIAADNCIIRGLVVNNFNPSGILILSNDNVIEGNFVGVDFTGTVAIGNNNGIELAENITGNLIGGSTSESRNLISGNARGLYIWGCNNNTISGNYIGVNINGGEALANTDGGLTLGEQAHDNIIGGITEGERNVISGNEHGAIGIFNSGTYNNIIIGNYIGTDFSGTSIIGNGWFGIGISDATTNNIIGGTTSGAQNLISGNPHGIKIQGAGTSENQILGNYIGTDVTGLYSLGNTNDGITIIEGASNNIVGGIESGAGNLISGNGRYGVNIGNSGTTGNIIQGNYIGTDLTGSSGIGNGKEGVCNWGGASSNLIGGDETGAGNIIAFNLGGGILMSNTNSTYQNTISRNSIFSNTEIGIDLSVALSSPYRDGISLNDVGDADSGPNNLQNFPVFHSVEIDNENLLIKYNVDSDSLNSTYPITIQFFKADNDGEGQIYLGSDTFLDADFSTGYKSINLGNANDLSISSSDLIVATATDNNGNTSEFSASFTTNIDALRIFTNSFELYPNPNSGTFFLELQNPKNEYYYLEIFNSRGHKVYERQLGSQIEILEEINITGKGIFLLKIQTNTKVQNKKVIIH